MADSSKTAHVQWVEIDSGHAGQRVDNFLMGYLKGVPRSLVYRILRTGEVRRNGGRIRAQDKLLIGDRVRIPPLRLPDREAPHVPVESLRQRIEGRILLEDDDLIVLNKPSGIAVHGGSGLSFGVIEALRAMRPDAKFLELVHRLDRETSGCLLIAKRRSALKDLHAQFREDDVNKVYLALLSGSMMPPRQTVEAPLKKNTLKSGERVVRVSEEGKPAVTLFRSIRQFKEATLVEARPITGRTHQIRVHASHLGLPIAGDERYGNDVDNRRFREWGLRRLFLHAMKAGFRHPRSGERMEVSAPLDDALEEVLKRLPPP